jgi:hypothetical protein
MKTIIVTGILFLLGCNGKNENDSGQLKQQITDADKAMSDLAAKDGFNNSILFYAETGIIKLGEGSLPVIGKDAFAASYDKNKDIKTIS